MKVKRSLVEQGVILPDKLTPDWLRTGPIHDHGLSSSKISESYFPGKKQPKLIDFVRRGVSGWILFFVFNYFLFAAKKYQRISEKK
jgi:hypothetical protein